jgi:hypothetical protein
MSCRPIAPWRIAVTPDKKKPVNAWGRCRVRAYGLRIDWSAIRELTVMRHRVAIQIEVRSLGELVVGPKRTRPLRGDSRANKVRYEYDLADRP